MSKEVAAPATEATRESQKDDFITQASQILRALKAGEKLTQQDALEKFGCSRLAAAIYVLERRGHQISRKLISVMTRGGRRARVALYWMDGPHAERE